MPADQSLIEAARAVLDTYDGIGPGSAMIDRIADLRAAIARVEGAPIAPTEPRWVRHECANDECFYLYVGDEQVGGVWRHYGRDPFSVNHQGIFFGIFDTLDAAKLAAEKAAGLTTDTKGGGDGSL